MSFSVSGRELPSETVAALIIACTDIDEILQTGGLTPDIMEEFEYLQPELQNFVNTQ